MVSMVSTNRSIAPYSVNSINRINNIKMFATRIQPVGFRELCKRGLVRGQRASALADYLELQWFIYEDRAKAVASFMAAIPLAFAVGSPVSGLLLGVHWFGLRGWQWLFIVEGLPALLFGVVTWFYLSDWPHQANWLPATERQWLINRLESEKRAKESVRSYTIWGRSATVTSSS